MKFILFLLLFGYQAFTQPIGLPDQVTVAVKPTLYGPMRFRLVNYTNTTTAQSSYATSNGIFYANELALCAVCSSKGSSPEVPTLAGNGMTWVAIFTTNLNTRAAPLNRITVFRSMTNATTPTGILTASGFSSATGGGLMVCTFSNVDTGGTYGSGAIVQQVGNSVDAGANPTLTLSALASSSNSVIAFFTCDVQPFAATPETYWTEDYDSGYNTTATGFYMVHRCNTVDFTAVATRASSDWGGWAAEIKVTP